MLQSAAQCLIMQQRLTRASCPTGKECWMIDCTEVPMSTDHPTGQKSLVAALRELKVDILRDLEPIRRELVGESEPGPTEEENDPGK